MSRFYIDTEFIEDGRTLDLLSVGVVSQDGREFYAINSACDTSKANDWVRDNVLCHITDLSLHTNGMPPEDIKTALKFFIGSSTHPEFWGDCCAYDYVALSWLFGGISSQEWPANWPFYFNDIQQFAHSLDAPPLPSVRHPSDKPHHALEDARAVQLDWFYLNALAHPTSAHPPSKPATSIATNNYTNHTAGWIRPHKIRHF